ncbi:MAG: ISNCY family transposase, partial [Bdellovibrio sp.]|nr:ISNCY family transposase [Bdellovibrio sp.]
MSSDESIRYQVITKFLNGILNREESARLLQVSQRTVSRIASKVKNKGIFGVKHGNLGKSPANRLPEDLKQTVIELLRTKYFDFNVKHFHEILVSEFNIPVSYRTLWSWCKEMKLVKNPRIKRRRKREYRHRMPQEGLLLQMDGCHHKFNGKDEWCLIAAIDDATSEIPYAEFFEGETTQACLKVLKRIIELKGLPKAIYTDRAGWAGGGKRVNFSQFKRACDELGIQVIFANSPEGKGRIERSFRTIQDRLIPELRINNANTLESANKYLQEAFLKDYWNKEKVVLPDNSEPAYSPPNPYLDLDMILSIHEHRKISSDQTTTWKNQR